VNQPVIAVSGSRDSRSSACALLLSMGYSVSTTTQSADVAREAYNNITTMGATNTNDKYNDNTITKTVEDKLDVHMDMDIGMEALLKPC
jgi:hypothetical protein